MLIRLLHILMSVFCFYLKLFKIIRSCFWPHYVVTVLECYVHFYYCSTFFRQDTLTHTYTFIFSALYHQTELYSEQKWMFWLDWLIIASKQASRCEAGRWVTTRIGYFWYFVIVCSFVLFEVKSRFIIQKRERFSFRDIREFHEFTRTANNL